MKIREVEIGHLCPNCKAPLKFERRVYSDKQMSEQKAHYEKVVKTRMFRFLRIGLAFSPFEEAMEMRCPKCQKLYHIEDGEEK